MKLNVIYDVTYVRTHIFMGNQVGVGTKVVEHPHAAAVVLVSRRMLCR